MEEIKRLVAEIKSLCDDRLDAKSAGGIILADAFKQLEALIEKKNK